MKRRFAVTHYRGQEMVKTVTLTGIELMDGWGQNAVATIRWTVGTMIKGEPYNWSEYTLIPEVRGDGGVWSALDLAGRLTEIKDLEFFNG